jgi:hypothetical protein
VKGQQQVFNTAEWYDYVLGFIVAAFLSGIGAFLVTLIGNIGFIGWFLIVIGAPTAGAVISEGVRAATRKHRSRPLFITVIAGVILGAVPIILLQLLLHNIFGILFQGIYLFIVVPVVYTRLSGIQLFR